jgi:spoIIIJ-associated protein
MDKDIKNIADELFSLLGIEAEIDVEKEDQEGQEVFMVEVKAPSEAGLLIGAHGSTLHAIQSFLAMAVKQKTGDWVRVVVDIGDWRQKHEEHLSSLAKATAERAKSTGEAQQLYNLTPAQRRIVHMALSKEEGIVTESEGEGASRYLVVKPE